MGESGGRTERGRTRMDNGVVESPRISALRPAVDVEVAPIE